MRFLAIYKKEMREALPWILAAAVICFIVLVGTTFGNFRLYYSNSWSKTADSLISPHQFNKSSQIAESGSVFFFISLGLGLALGVHQFWMPKFSRTWAFTLHRSIKRERIFFAKFAASVTAFILGLGIPWMLCYLYITRPGMFPMPPTFRNFLEGWAFILVGVLVYVGTAISGLSTGKLFGTKMFCLIFAGFVTLIAFNTESLMGFTITILIGLALLVPQLFNIFMSREF